MGYSSWNTAANSTGIALANSIARYSYINAFTPTQESNENFIKLMTFSYLKDIAYKSYGFQSMEDDLSTRYSFPYILEKLNQSDIIVNFKHY